MPAVNEVYICCERCGLVVEVRKAGHCIPQCCDQEMRLKVVSCSKPKCCIDKGIKRAIDKEVLFGLCGFESVRGLTRS